ncbi:MAG: hypothetical protein K8J08_18405 [Thermoanaerobaculia bacterium]|nr:hypothetical protein [Thermoanaerobaculia bacterium]
MKVKNRCIGLACLVVGLFLPALASAGTQDFWLYNQSGVLVHELYLSPSASSDWEEDVLGDDVLDDGETLHVAFRGREACRWDFLLVDSEGGELIFEDVNLCSVSKVALRCDSSQCWAATE